MQNAKINTVILYQIINLDSRVDYKCHIHQFCLFFGRLTPVSLFERKGVHGVLLLSGHILLNL